ncbi:thiopurine S-methyltransferase [Parashewanella tropica]|uniref:thiopurine S-methyltransferase n=1 Tax=Parashewanella tropica TaxID=2547970 RepID=UPI001059449C|nr:thiopurine S-methyltransferase [Parashewanella tropica]
MQHEEWISRWKENRIGFHRQDFNNYLLEYWPQSSSGSVFVPLCGKSLDLIWLAKQGHKVIGSELITKAVEAFYEEQNLPYQLSNYSTHTTYSNENICIHQGDFFRLPEELMDSEYFYDRAALIALPKEYRQDYAKQLLQVAPRLKQGLLITLEYDQNIANGPPFAVLETEINELFGEQFIIEKLTQEIVPAFPSAVEKGITEFNEVVYQLIRKK